jgi:glycosyltransferase involved in cell wall biosynthesis
MSTHPVFTVCTPTYNRAPLLGRVYASLAAQNFTDFEWIVVDDGSTDDTRSVVQDLQSRARFPIHYLWQENRHKKVAFNRGVAQALGTLLVALDDDDEIPPDTLANLARIWEGIPDIDRERFVGVTGLCARPDGTVVGDHYPKDVFDCSAADMYFKHRVRGEKFGCMRVDLLKRFPFPEDIDGFVPESLVWWAIARAGYINRFVNQIVRVYHPTPGSLSVQQGSATRNAAGLYLLNWDMLEHHLGAFFYKPREFIAAAARVTRFRSTLRQQDNGNAVLQRYPLTRWAAHFLVVCMWPLGWLLYRRDRGSRKKLNGAATEA